MNIGRREPYTSTGISRIPCARCGKPSKFQWQCCANDNRWLGVCERCDVELNALVLKFFRFKDVRRRVEEYKRRIES